MKKTIIAPIIRSTAVAAAVMIVGLSANVYASESQNNITPIQEITIYETPEIIDGTPSPDGIVPIQEVIVVQTAETIDGTPSPDWTVPIEEVTVVQTVEAINGTPSPEA